MSLDAETGRDRYFEARDRELAEFVDPATGRLVAELAQAIDCPLCGSGSHSTLFEKQGFAFVRCSHCGLVFVNPRLKDDVLLDQYRSAETNELWFDVLTSERQLALDREKFGAVLEALAPYRHEGRILDVGSSIGLLLELAREQGWDGVGIELAPRALAHARERLGLEVLDVPLAEAGFPPESFDAVTLLSVLEHAVEPLELLSECARVLRPEGALYAIVPNVESLACRVLHAQARTFDGRNHLVYFSAATLSQALERTGFEPVWTATKVSSLGPVLDHLAFADPYGGADREEDPLARWASLNVEETERMIEALGLGYKLHCLATKRS